MKNSTCKICNVDFGYNPIIQKGIYCSKTCRYKDHSNIIKKSYTLELKEKKRQLALKQWMKTENERIEKKRKEHESMNHKIGRPKTSIEKIGNCKQCGKLFTITNDNGLFCSRNCYLKLKRENSTNYRIKAFALLPNECFYCQSKEKLLVHHKNKDWLDNDIENLQILCPSCHRKQHKDDNSRFKQFKEGDILRGLRLVLSGLRVDLKDENFKGTPERVLRSFYEIYEGQVKDLDKKLEEIFSARFPSEYNGLVILDNIQVFSTCPHHLRDIEYTVDVGYISKKWAIGISKLPRAVELLARRLVLQESFTNDIAKYMMKYLEADGVMVVVKGKHNCMRMRGIQKPDSVTTTSSVCGTFRKDLGARQEFLSLIKK